MIRSGIIENEIDMPIKWHARIDVESRNMTTRRTLIRHNDRLMLFVLLWWRKLRNFHIDWIIDSTARRVWRQSSTEDSHMLCVWIISCVVNSNASLKTQFVIIEYENIVSQIMLMKFHSGCDSFFQVAAESSCKLALQNNAHKSDESLLINWNTFHFSWPWFIVSAVTKQAQNWVQKSAAAQQHRSLLLLSWLYKPSRHMLLLFRVTLNIILRAMQCV